MRIFYALTFEENIKEKINYFTETVANHALKGRFISQNNIHLTLHFIGEVSPEDLDMYEQILHDLPTEKLTLQSTFIGAFKKKNRNVIWLGLEKNTQYNEIVKEIQQYLEANDVIVDKRKNHPHITLGRQVLLDMNLSDFVIPIIELPVKSIALMVSHRVHDQLTYEPIYERLLD